MAQTKPNPRLLSLLEKLNNPLQLLNLQFSVLGVYSFPDEWKTTDDSNPGIFTYQVRYLKPVDGGKTYPRELTEREKREQDEILAAKGKKAVKKDPKEQLNVDEEERLQNVIKQEDEEEKKKQDHYQSLSKIEQFYFTSEDKNKSQSLKFEDGTKSVIFEGDKVQEFEDRVYNNGGMQIQFVKLPLVSEEEVQKLRKAKPKNLNIAELQPVVYKAWLSLKDFQEPGCAETIQRCQLEQVIEEGQDVPKFNLDRTYLKIKISLSPAITQLIEEIRPVAELCEQYNFSLKRAPTRNDCLMQFKQDIVLAMQSLSNEYLALFSKDNNDNKSKQMSTMTIQKKLELQKKKEQFLQEINTQGKYKLLKDRLRRSIIRVCIDKFQKQGLYTGVTKDDKDRLFAELYVFLMKDMQQTLGEFINTNKEDIHEDLVASYEQNIKERDKVFTNLTREGPQEKFQRLATEYEILNIKDQAIKNYNNMISLNPEDHNNLFVYAKYCLRIKDFKKAEQLIERAFNIEPLTDYKLLIISLYIRRERFKEAELLTKELLLVEPINTLYIVIMSVILKQKGDLKLCEKYKRCTERIFMRTMGLLNTKNSNKVQVNPHILPNLKQQTIELQEMAKKAPVLSNEQLDHVQMEVIEYFGRMNLMDLVEKSMPNMLDKTTSKMTILKAQVQIFKENHIEALNILNKFLDENPKNYEVHIIKGTLCYQSEQFYEAEEIFLKALRIKQSKPFAIYLRLGFMYIKRKSWEDAKVILAKALDISNNSSLSWIGMGIATLRLGELSFSEECMTQANIYEPFNGEVWGYLALLCLQQGKRGQQALQCIEMMDKTEVNDSELLEELGDEMYKNSNFEASKSLFHRIFQTAELRAIKLPNIGGLQCKLGKVYDSLKKYDLARNYYELALKNLEGENEKAQVQLLVDNLAE